MNNVNSFNYYNNPGQNYSNSVKEITSNRIFLIILFK